MVYFLMPSGKIPRLFRKAELCQESNAYHKISYRVITPEDSSNLQVSYAHLPPNEPSERRIHKHGEGQEMVIVLDGCAHVMVEEEHYKVCLLYTSCPKRTAPGRNPRRRRRRLSPGSSA